MLLRTHDRYGNRIDEVEFHPAWHDLMRVAVSSLLVRHGHPTVADAFTASRLAGDWGRGRPGRGRPGDR